MARRLPYSFATMFWLGFIGIQFALVIYVMAIAAPWAVVVYALAVGAVVIAGGITRRIIRAVRSAKRQ